MRVALLLEVDKMPSQPAFDTAVDDYLKEKGLFSGLDKMPVPEETTVTAMEKLVNENVRKKMSKGNSAYFGLGKNRDKDGPHLTEVGHDREPSCAVQ